METRPAKRINTKSPDKLDKFRLHLLDGKILHKKDIDMLSKYRKANALFCLGYSKNHVITVLTKEDLVSESQAYMILRDAVKLYGDVSEIDKKGAKQAAYEYYMMLSNLARKKEDYQSAIKAKELADKVMGLFDTDESPIDAKEFMKPVNIIFNTDPEVLKKKQRIELENESGTEAQVL